jgi:flagellar motor switch protein FliM
MADKILSQDEVDALFKGVSDGDVDTAPPPEEPGGVKAYDLQHQERIIRGRMPALEMINDRFVRRQSASWGSVLRESVEIMSVGTEVMKFGEFLKRVPMPSSLSVFHMSPLRGNGLFVMDAGLVYLIVDHFFGGKGQTHVKPEGRDFTNVQQRVIKTLVGHVFEDLEKAWSGVHPVTIRHVRSESNPQFAMVVSPSEIVLVITFQVQLGETVRDLYLMYPYATVEPIKEKLYSGLVSDHLEQDGGWSGRFRNKLADCAVNVVVQLGTATVKVRDVLNFSPGDVVVLDQRPGDPMQVFVEGIRKFEGSPGTFKGNHACRLTRAASSL